MNTKRKILTSLGIGLITLVIFGIFNNPDKKNEKMRIELEQIITSINIATREVNKSIAENEACFGDESIKNDKSADCVINIRNIQDTFKITNETNIANLQTFYQTNQSNFDNITKDFIENNLRLYKSEPYSNSIEAYDQYFSAYIKWHKYFRDYIGIKGLDNMTSEEIMMAKTLAQNILSNDENLKLKTTTFSDYLNENFSKEFVQSMTQSSVK